MFIVGDLSFFQCHSILWIYNSDQQKYMLNMAKIHDNKTTNISGIIPK